MSVLRTLSCGATALLPITGGADEFVRDGHNGVLVETSDVHAVHAALAGLVDDRERLAALQQGASETASRYSAVGAALSEYVLFCHYHARSRTGVAATLAPAR